MNAYIRYIPKLKMIRLRVTDQRTMDIVEMVLRDIGDAEPDNKQLLL